MERDRIQIGPNLQSAVDTTDAIDKNIADELEIGRRKGPFIDTPFDKFLFESTWCCLQKRQSKPRVIHHLSWPRSALKTSVNASIYDFRCQIGCI